MTQDPSTNELELRKAFNHTAKLVPMSQREIFLDECVRITNRLIDKATREARVEQATMAVYAAEKGGDTEKRLLRQLEQQTKSTKEKS